MLREGGAERRGWQGRNRGRSGERGEMKREERQRERRGGEGEEEWWG